jgi:hypothetical protein
MGAARLHVKRIDLRAVGPRPARNSETAGRRLSGWLVVERQRLPQQWGTMMARVTWMIFGVFVVLWTCTVAFGLVYGIAGWKSAVVVGAIVSWAILQVLERAGPAIAVR